VWVVLVGVPGKVIGRRLSISGSGPYNLRDGIGAKPKPQELGSTVPAADNYL